MGGRVGDALVEGHDDVGAEGVLNPRRLFRAEKDFLFRHFMTKMHAVIGDLFFRQGKDLETAAVGEDRFRPVHERMQAAGLLHQAFPRLQVQVIGIGEDDLRPGFIHLRRASSP